MKMIRIKDKYSEIGICGVLIICLLLSTELLPGFMPSSLVMLALAVFIAAFSLFVILVWKERPRDEREAHIILSSDRLAFLVGSIALSVLLIVQSLRHEPTGLIALALSLMIVAKIIAKYLHK